MKFNNENCLQMLASTNLDCKFSVVYFFYCTRMLIIYGLHTNNRSIERCIDGWWGSQPTYVTVVRCPDVCVRHFAPCYVYIGVCPARPDYKHGLQKPSLPWYHLVSVSFLETLLTSCMYFPNCFDLFSFMMFGQSCLRLHTEVLQNVYIEDQVLM